MLIHPSTDTTIAHTCDASDIAIGAVIYYTDQGEMHPLVSSHAP